MSSYLSRKCEKKTIVRVLLTTQNIAQYAWFSERGSSVEVDDLDSSASGEESGRAVDVIVDEIKA